MANNLWIGGVVLIIIGILILIAGLILKYYNISLRPYRGYAEAKVVDIVTLKREGGKASEFQNRQAAVIEFYAGGKPVKVTDREDSFPCRYKLNEAVRLCYDPADPAGKYLILKNENIKSLSVAANIIGIIMILGGLMIFLRYAMRYVL